jgi:hypothetical protein
MQIPIYNGKMKILFSELHHRTNLTGPKTQIQTQNFEICKFKGLLQIPNFECYFELSSVQYDESIALNQNDVLQTL